MRKINELGIELIKKFEGYSPTPYICSGGYNTIGYGHKIKSSEQLNKIGRIKAEKLLKSDIEEAEKAVCRYVRPDITDNQFSSLVSFTYNLGSSTLQRSTLRQKINYGSNIEEVCNEFLRWIFAGGKKINGLISRRHAESMIYYEG